MIRFQNEHFGGCSIGQQVLQVSGMNFLFSSASKRLLALAISVSLKSMSMHLPSTSHFA
jgi:hypothetical protein